MVSDISDVLEFTANVSTVTIKVEAEGASWPWAENYIAHSKRRFFKTIETGPEKRIRATFFIYQPPLQGSFTDDISYRLDYIVLREELGLSKKKVLVTKQEADRNKLKKSGR